MTTDICSEDVIVQMAPQVAMTSEGAGAGGGVARGGSGGALELGRRLLLAARAGDTALVLDLMAKGAPFTADWLGTSPLHLAAGHDHAATCGVLLRAGVSRDSRTKVERTPLHLAACAGHAGVAALLLRHGALVDPRDLLRMTPLHWAAQRGHAAVAAALLRHGADPAARSKFGLTPLQLAARRGHTELQRLLEAAAAARAVRPLHSERSAEEPAESPERQVSAPVRKVPEIKSPIEVTDRCRTTKTKQTQEMPIKIEEEVEAPTAAAALLRRHGIALLPPDPRTTAHAALQHGRTLVLSDAGRLMLQETARPEGQPPPAPCATPAPAPAPARDSPKKVKIVQLVGDSKTATRRGAGSPGKPRPPVKIIMNKSNFQRLVAANVPPPSAAAPPDDVTRLKHQLAASQKTVARLTEELKLCRAKLAQYEGP